MSWLTNLPPGLKNVFGKKDTPENLWIKCPKSGDLVYKDDLEASLFVTPAGAHLRVGPDLRFKSMFDGSEYEELELPEVVKDPLKFKDDRKYVDRLKSSRAKTGREDCMAAAIGKIGKQNAVVLVQDFAFMGGSLGMAAGEAFITAAEKALETKSALIICTASGGARMQEGALSLMQMPRTTVAITELKDASLPYIVVLTDPTTGGVAASYAMIGDIHIGEPEAMVAFAGARVIEQTIREKLPEGFQRAEFLRERGMVDMVVDRRDLPAKLGQILSMLMGGKPLPEVEPIAVADVEELEAAEAEAAPDEVVEVEAPAVDEIVEEKPAATKAKPRSKAKSKAAPKTDE
ncbi:acetyl-CoA carboxylase carboxyltransferase subunit beta [Hirschia baltica]|uniref:Acetyl-coenzyme A carboxylase carboxyl transferase subunit beta n=1 Tax=Hirschia baltica (strain ATCC 49814 / DSM 5838 / IFAM 1418) TaxID=582402 RepID=ACCD_HIRBI|nr:acetyl-CoA carboxylase carboxyltransferase subunit beta [Hirschia baltica]C6XMV9.1 RecName: Full=Acetyl-coenzyme A carboxylase carboxyl transferase subunit beta; Short=ACCase subunit beta; Short=Acetyl-CoA carboxylase carboxyltransferase subunit beta [Hirschia baltica ATCC 49814]ACT60023.1 acetyl-CoA carboxylase, carboxyl transferase, beta subunit [Hirschia baltica ATCC 49814]